MTTPSEPDDARDAGLTTGAVARRLGVAPTTLRSWHRRYGIGPARHEGGRHRRWTADDLAVLDRMCALTGTGLAPAEAARLALARAHGPAPGVPPQRVAALPALAPDSARQECRGLARAARRLDAHAVEVALTSAVTEHGLVTAWSEIIVPTLMAVGRAWQRLGERHVAVEHLLSWQVSCALRRHTVPVPERPGPPVLLACVPGEGHTLPLEALGAALAAHGHPVRMFGAALPAEALDCAVRATGPAAVVLWSQSRTTANRVLARHCAAITWGVRGARTHPVLVTAGPGWAGPHVPGAVRPLTLREALGTLEPLLAA
ncbi:MerR family transcriptional regulator [Streptomyces sp. NPDC057638]|uniref:MerR family transcriptional regulator n=1 Tax=Streptomyces sp. NPDC057638 TaxID=3346190 RepID=UPI00369F8380